MSGSDGSATKIDELLHQFILVLDDVRKSNGRSLPMMGCSDTYSILSKNKLLPRVKAKPPKSDRESARNRIAGDVAYSVRKWDAARKRYTSAICSAESEECIALGYAGRSAVHYKLGAYVDAINDVTHALNTGKYPLESHHLLYERRARSHLGISEYTKALADAEKALSCIASGYMDTEAISDIIKGENLDRVKVLLTEQQQDPEKVKRIKSLVNCIVDCIGKTDVARAVPKEPKLSHKQCDDLAGAFCAMELTTSPKMGRHMIATTEIVPGDILAVEKPVVSVLKPEFYDSFCDYCKARTHSSIPCLNCNYVVFCSERCRRASWESHHAIECDMLPTFIDLGLKLHVLNAIRAFLVATKCGKDLEGHKDNREYHAINNLATHEKYRLRPKIIAMASCVLHILMKSTRLFENFNSASTNSRELLGPNHILAGNFIVKCLKMVPYNAFDIGESRLTPTMDFDFTLVGGALYSTLCLINHSCDPNVFVYLSDEQTRVITAVKPIKKGQQIFVTYGPMFIHQSRDDRQRELKRKYLFDCCCAPCLYNWPIWADLADVPRFARGIRSRERADVNESVPELHDLWQAIEHRPITSDQAQAVLYYLYLYDKCVQRPWKYQYVAEEVIKKHINYQQKYVIEKKGDGSAVPFYHILILLCIVVVVGINLLVFVDEKTLTHLSPAYLLSFASRPQSNIVS